MEELLIRMEKLEKELAALRARTQIEDLGARYADMMLAGDSRKILEELWVSDGDIRFETGSSGVYEGERVRFFYDKEAVPGRFIALQLTTPYIKTDEEARNARALWMVIGAECDAGELGCIPPKDEMEKALLSSEDKNGKRYKAEWFWQRMEALLVQENGAWKIRSLHMREIFRTPYDKSWVEWADVRQLTDGLRTDALFTPASASEEELRPPEFNASYATTDHWQYRTDALPPKRLIDSGF